MRDFYQKYFNSVRGFVSKRIGDEGTVDELTDDILLSAYESLPNFNQKCSEFSFICSIAKHKIIDYYRKKKIKTVLFSASPLFEEIADKAIGPERDALKNELIEEIEETLKEVKEGYGKLLRLKYVEGWKTRAIAALTKLSVKAVESRLVRAKKQFQQLWNYDKKKAKESVEIRNTDRD
jgi:RNA polymerase sigma-70 factor (ECF subfamily)